MSETNTENPERPAENNGVVAVDSNSLLSLDTTDKLLNFLLLGKNLAVDIDKREVDWVYTVKNQDCDILAVTNKLSFSKLRAIKRLSTNRMHYAWRCDRGWHDFLG